MKIAVLFDGGGLARQGLEDAGHDCTGYEIDPAKHYLSQMTGSGNSVLADVRDVDLSGYDAVWASPPCQERSDQKTSAIDIDNLLLLDWTLRLKERFSVIWIENVISNEHDNSWGVKYNAAQFLEKPLQRRRRIIGGNYTRPSIWRDYKADYPEWAHYVPPAMVAYEIYKSDRRSIDRERNKFSRWYMRYKQRRPTLFDMAYHQGFDMPLAWLHAPVWWKYTQRQWLVQVVAALGNGVPVYMAYAFGAVYSNAPVDAPKQLEFFGAAL